MDKKTEQWGGSVSGTSPIRALGSGSEARHHINCYIVSFKQLPPRPPALARIVFKGPVAAAAAGLPLKSVLPWGNL